MIKSGTSVPLFLCPIHGEGESPDANGDNPVDEGDPGCKLLSNKIWGAGSEPGNPGKRRCSTYFLAPVPANDWEVNMQLHEFLNQVQNTGNLSSQDEVLNATRATLMTLAERLRGNEPHHLAAQLPQGLQEFLHGENAGKGERFGSDEFMRRVGDREGVNLETATAHARAVLATLTEAVDSGEMEDVKQQLPKDIKRLLNEVSGLH
jgi:uncharacterized protein (DUF2267 family)